MWRELEAGRARNVRIRRRNASRYTELAHDFSFCVAVYGKGAAVHKFIANTLFGMLPSRQHTLHQRLKGAAVLHEVGYLESRFAAARRYYDELGYKLHMYFTSSDATATRMEATIRLNDNAIFGLCTLDAISAPATVYELEMLILKHKLAKQVDVVLLNPLDSRYPPFVLGVFPQCSSPPADLLIERWGIVRQPLDALGMCIIGHGADGDAAQLAALSRRMASATSLEPSENVRAFTFCGVPSITGGTFNVSAPARRVALPQLELAACFVPDLGFEDMVHLALKLRGRILNRDCYGVWLGNSVASLSTLQQALLSIRNVDTESTIALRKSDLNPKDRMNYPAAARLLQPAVRDFLESTEKTASPAPCAPSTAPLALPPAAGALAIAPPLLPARNLKKRKGVASAQSVPPTRPPPAASHLRFYLLFASRATAAFLGHGTVLERLHDAFYARYFADGWRAWLQRHGIPLGDNFITTNQYSCIVLNANSLLLFYHWLCSHPQLRKHVPASVFVLGTQFSENNFRDTRAICLDPNFTVQEFGRRQTLVQELERIKRKRAADFAFPVHRKHVHADNIHRPPIYLEENVQESTLRSCLASALAAAERDLRLLGVHVPVTDCTGAPPVTDLATAEDIAVDGAHAAVDEEDDVEEDEEASRNLADVDDAELVPGNDLDPDDSLLLLSLAQAADGALGIDEDAEERSAESESNQLAPDSADAAAAAQRRHFSARTAIARTSRRLKRTIYNEETKEEVNLQSAAAQLSGHVKQSADRTVRVRSAKGAKSKSAK